MREHRAKSAAAGERQAWCRCLQLEVLATQLFGSVRSSSPVGNYVNRCGKMSDARSWWCLDRLIHCCSLHSSSFTFSVQHTTTMEPPEEGTAQDPKDQNGPSQPGFQSALSVSRSTHQPSLSSNRNAGGGLPPVPKAWEKESGSSEHGSASVAKPVNRPASSKNAIVHSVLQVGSPNCAADGRSCTLTPLSK